MSARRRSTAERRALEGQLPLVAAALSRSVHSGATLRTALEEAAGSIDDPAESDLARIIDRVSAGSSLEVALRDWAERRELRAVDLLVAAALLGHGHGGDLTGALDGVAVSLSDRIEVEDEARALATQARTSAFALCALPPFGALCMSLLDPAVGRLLITTPAGWTCLAVGAMLDVVGLRVMSSMVNGAIR